MWVLPRPVVVQFYDVMPYMKIDVLAADFVDLFLVAFIIKVTKELFKQNKMCFFIGLKLLHFNLCTLQKVLYCTSIMKCTGWKLLLFVTCIVSVYNKSP